MASVPLSGGAGNGAAAPFDRKRWSESKVYTRKSHGKSAKLAAVQTSHQTLATTTTAEDLNSSLQEAPPAPDLASQGQQRPISPVSDDEASSNHHRRPSEQQKGKRQHVKISVAGRPTQERRQIRRRLAAELDRVREVVKRLEAHEVQFSSGGGAPSQLSVNVVAAKRAPVVSEVASTAPGPLGRQLSVSVLPGIGGGDASSIGDPVEKEKRTPKANQYYRSSEFILGKEKIPPPESHSHKKSKGSKKHSVGDSDHRMHVGDKKLLSDVFRSCKLLLHKLMKHKFSWVFNKPVDAKGLGLHDYYTIIKHPMDLGTVKSRIAKDWYSSPKEFAEDVRLTFRNAMTYNPKGQDVHYMAEQLSNMFEEQWPAIEAQYNYHLRPPQQVSRKTVSPVDMTKTFERSDSMMQPVVVDSRPKQVKHTTPHTGRKTALMKPKAKDLNKREMTFEEKQKLSRHLQSLPPEKLDAIVLIIKKNNSNVNQNDDEIEVDIDSMDTETLWELDRFVVNYKKSLSKHKRKLERAMEARAMAQHHNQDILQSRNSDLVSAEIPKATGAVGDQKNAAASLPGHQDDNDDSGSSGSSSSSSDSGSSSSDSESDSSSDD